MPNKKARRKHREQHQAREGYAVELVEASGAVQCSESEEFEIIEKPPQPVQVSASQVARVAPSCVVC